MSSTVIVLDARADLDAAMLKLREMAAAAVPAAVMERTLEIVQTVAARGDNALVEYTRMFDWPQATVESLVIDHDELDEAFRSVDRDWLNAFRRAKDNLYRYHERQAPRSWMQDFDGMVLGQYVKPIRAAGLCVPGKMAPLPSTVAHCAVPAQVAGVSRLVMVTPPGPGGAVDPMRLVAASECGIEEVYRVGGAQAVAALAFGTDTISPVDKIVGPGNSYVTAAKRLVFGRVGIDGLAGPSEAVIVADATARPDLVAADLMAQAEHTGDNLVVLLTPSEGLVDAVLESLDRLLGECGREDLICQSLQDCGAILLVDSIQQALDCANEIAPEHLQLMVEDPLAWLGEVQSAGAIFLGYAGAVPLGDYAAGPSHVLPTNRSARFSSGLSVTDFVTASTVLMPSDRAVEGLASDVIALAEAEGLSAHALAIRLRLNKGPAPE